MLEHDSFIDLEGLAWFYYIYGCYRLIIMRLFCGSLYTLTPRLPQPQPENGG